MPTCRSRTSHRRSSRNQFVFKLAGQITSTRRIDGTALMTPIAWIVLPTLQAHFVSDQHTTPITNETGRILFSTHEPVSFLPTFLGYVFEHGRLAQEALRCSLGRCSACFRPRDGRLHLKPVLVRASFLRQSCECACRLSWCRLSRSSLLFSAPREPAHPCDPLPLGGNDTNSTSLFGLGTAEPGMRRHTHGT